MPRRIGINFPKLIAMVAFVAGGSHLAVLILQFVMTFPSDPTIIATLTPNKATELIWWSVPVLLACTIYFFNDISGDSQSYEERLAREALDGANIFICLLSDIHPLRDIATAIFNELARQGINCYPSDGEDKYHVNDPTGYSRLSAQPKISKLSLLLSEKSREPQGATKIAFNLVDRGNQSVLHGWSWETSQPTVDDCLKRSPRAIAKQIVRHILRYTLVSVKTATCGSALSELGCTRLTR